VPVAYECYEGTIHGFMNMGRVLRRAHGKARQRLASWLAERLHGVEKGKADTYQSSIDAITDD
ncbi:MAG: hypothetical protein ACXWVI_03850, partial [Methyloceanibacter sp.]